MTQTALVWIAARDGSIHATVPPILALGQAMLCARLYGRLDLRVRSPLVPGDPHAVGTCTECGRAADIWTGTRAFKPQGTRVLAP